MSPGSQFNHRKINEVYGVDISDIESGELVQIFQRIAEKG
jgi:hypothetical protein